MVVVYPDLMPSPTLAYVIGVLKGDGTVCVTKRGDHLIGLQQTRKEFAESFEKALKQISLHPFHYTFQSKKPKVFAHKISLKPKLKYCVEASSKLFCEWYQLLDLNWIKENPEFLKEFIRGFYESEGTHLSSPRARIALYNQDEYLLLFVEDCLGMLGFDNVKEYFGGVCNGVSALMIHGRSDVNQFLETIQPVIKNGYECD